MLTFLTLLVLPSYAADVDGDGFDSVDDCDDTDAAVFPGADEGNVADRVDQDCSGIADDRFVCSGPGSWLQQAIDDAPDGFTLSICPGNHRQKALVDGRVLTLRSTGSWSDTALNGESSGSPLRVRGGADLTVEGITLMNGISGANGGGLRCTSSTLNLTASRLLNNSAANGGGVSADGCNLSIQQTLFKNNSASGNGGGLWVNGGSGSLSGSQLVGGTALEGGGLWADSSFTVSSTFFKQNTATSTANDYVGGGGAWVSDDVLVISSTFALNHAEMCGGGLYARFNDGDVIGNVFQANTAADDGAGVYFDWSEAVFAANNVLYNDAQDDAGGLRIYHGSMVVEDNLLQGNTANDDGGGAKLSHADHVYRRNVHRNNSAGDAGGGLELDNETTHIEDCVFDGNEAGRGGGLHSWRNEGPFDIVDSTFSDNHVTECGGAMAFDNDTYLVTAQHLDIFGNESDDDGGALCVEYREQDSGLAEESNILLANSTVYGNDAVDEGGVAQVSHGSLQIDQALLVQNRAGQGSQGLADEDGSMVIRNSILFGGGGGSLLDAESGGTLSIAYSALYGGSGGYGALANPIGVNGNIGSDPQVDQSTGHLLAGSPCIDAGSPLVLDVDGSVSDMGRYGGPSAE